MRALRAAQKAGLQVARIEIDRDGKIVVVAGNPETHKRNELDRWIQKHAHSTEGA